MPIFINLSTHLHLYFYAYFEEKGMGFLILLKGLVLVR